MRGRDRDKRGGLRPPRSAGQIAGRRGGRRPPAQGCRSANSAAPWDMFPSQRLFPLALMALAGCTSRDSRLASAVVDTLPSGTITVHNTAPAAWSDSSHAWHFVEVARIEGTADTTSPLINPGASALDALGRVVVVERSPASIKVLERDGRLLRRFSREGSGPGELRNPSLVAFDSLIVVDD